MIRPPLPFIVKKKPELPQQIKEQRKKKLIRMTLVAALSGRDGTILFGDTEETVAGYTKRTIDKLVVVDGAAFRFGIAGACTDGNYADMLQSEICDVLGEMQQFELGQIKLGLTGTLTNFYLKHIWPRAGEKPEVEFLLVLQSLDGGHPTVVHVAETAVTICTEATKTIGVGSYLADYLLKSMTDRQLPFPPNETIDFLCASAVYVAREVRENIQGVGPLSRVAVFNADGTYDDLYPIDVSRIEEAISPIGEFLHYFYADAFHAESQGILGAGESNWADGICEGVKEWYAAWMSEEERKRRESIRGLQKRRQRPANE